MHLTISIDDTDNKTSPGSGQLAERLAGELISSGLAESFSPISRHQLFFDDCIPYTSHNSAMCFTAELGSSKKEELIEFASAFLVENSASGSDPGLCVVNGLNTGGIKQLMDFGSSAKKMCLTKNDAYGLAASLGIHLSEHGGTGDGVIGALAGVGLRLSGVDGRFRGWLNLGEQGETIEVAELASKAKVDGIFDLSGKMLSGRELVSLSSKKTKTVLYNHSRVIPVSRKEDFGPNSWVTLTPAESKIF